MVALNPFQTLNIPTAPKVLVGDIVRLRTREKRGFGREWASARVKVVNRRQLIVEFWVTPFSGGRGRPESPKLHTDTINVEDIVSLSVRTEMT